MISEKDYRPMLAEVNDILSGGGQPEAVKAMTVAHIQTPAGCWEHSGNSFVYSNSDDTSN